MTRKAVLWLVLFTSGFLTALILVGPVGGPGAWAGKTGECIAGDIDGNGRLQVTDAVRLLRFLFRDGSPPAECCDDGAAGDGFFLNRLDAVTFVIVRHAERETGADPGLLPEGQKRAERLAEILADAPVTHLIASDLRRTTDTLAPLSARKNIQPEEIEKIADDDDVVARLEELPAGSLAVIAHHSFTIPGILRKLGIDSTVVSDVGTSYDNFLVVVRSGDSPVDLVRLKYSAED